jgi:hypothetical protein
MADEGLQQSGVVLVAKGYQQYLQRLQQVNKAQKETFQDGAKQAKRGAKETSDAVKDTTSSLEDASRSLTLFRGALLSLASGNIIGGIKALKAALISLKAAAPILLAIAAAIAVVSKIVSAVGGLIKFAKASGDVAQRNETLLVSLQQVGLTAGYTAEQIGIAEEAVRKKGITTQAARQSLIRMAQAEIEWSDAADLARIAQDAAVVGNINSSEAFERMITGIQRGETEILKNIGINVSFEQSYVKMAAQLDINRKQLTEQQKAQARANAVLAAGEKISGAYTAAMETSGKQQRSLERLIEETQGSMGKLLLPFKELQIQMKTEKWKGLHAIAMGLSQMEPAIRAVIDAAKLWYGWMFKALGQLLGLKEGVSIFYKIGESIHTVARTTAILATAFKSVVQTISEDFAVLFGDLATGFNQLINRDFVGLAKTAASIGRRFKEEFRVEDFGENLKDNFVKLKQEFPDLFKSFDELMELSEAAEDALDRPASAADRLAAELAELQGQLEQQMGVLKKFEQIQDQYQRGQADALNRYNEKLADLEQDLAKSIAKAQEKASRAMIKLSEDATEKRADINKDYEASRVKAIQEHHRSMVQEQRRFELSRMQNLRRFRLQERRLMAEGDVLGLMQLREDEELRKKEEQEDRTESKRTAQEQLQWELQNMKEGMEEKLRDLDEDIAKRRASIQESYTQELEDLVQSNQERKAEATADYQKRLEELKNSRSQQLQELGKSYQEEGEITEEAMSEIAQKIADLYGDQGVYDAIMAGWDERTRGVMNELYADVMAQLEDIAQQMAYIEETGEVPPGGDGGGRRRRRSRGTRGRNRVPVGMRSGGVGVVTGPALFEVEPGVKEIVAFAPIPGGMQHGQLDVGVSGNIGFPDAAASGASPAIVEAAVEQTLAEIQHAVRRLAKR